MDKKIWRHRIPKLYLYSDAISGCSVWVLAHPEFGSWVNPIPTRRADYYLPTRIWKPNGNYKQSGFEIPNFFNCPSIIYGCSLLSEINSSSLLCELFIGKKAKEWILKVPFFGLKIDGKRTGAENDIL